MTDEQRVNTLRQLVVDSYASEYRLTVREAIHRLMDDLVDEIGAEADREQLAVGDDMPDDPESYRNFRAEEMP